MVGKGKMSTSHHWNEVYKQKPITQMSWYEPMPEHSIKCIQDFAGSKEAAVIDIGGGDSFLSDFLLSSGYSNLSILDISETALERAKTRIGERAGEIRWIVSDILDFESGEKYDIWHDRAAFHFLTAQEEVDKYLEILRKSLKPGGLVILGTFSQTGPDTCSGLPVKKYDAGQLQELFSKDFSILGCSYLEHQTPTGKVQPFTFCCFRKSK